MDKSITQNFASAFYHLHRYLGESLTSVPPNHSHSYPDMVWATHASVISCPIMVVSTQTWELHQENLQYLLNWPSRHGNDKNRERRKGGRKGRKEGEGEKQGGREIRFRRGKQRNGMNKMQWRREKSFQGKALKNNPRMPHAVGIVGTCSELRCTGICGLIFWFPRHGYNMAVLPLTLCGKQLQCPSRKWQSNLLYTWWQLGVKI